MCNTVHKHSLTESAEFQVNRVTQLSIPPLALRNAALDAVDNGEPYSLWADQFTCLEELQIISGPSTERHQDHSIGAWNLERGRDWREASKVIREQRLDIVLLSEMDYGMSRSGRCTQLNNWLKSSVGTDSLLSNLSSLNWVMPGSL